MFSAAWGAAQGHPKSYEKYLDLTKLLLERGADVTLKLNSGDTVLHKVARSYSEQHASTVCELLIAKGAEVNEHNANGQTPLDEALANERNTTAELLRKFDAKTGEELKTAGS
ncbi:MAG: ankyrin repeat domain-containing protein [Planctomycetota bacterium]